MLMDRHIIQSQQQQQQQQQQHVNFVSNIRKKELKSFSMESLKRKRIKTTSCFSNGAFDVKRGLVISVWCGQGAAEGSNFVSF